MDKIPLLLMFLGHVAVDASQGILPVVAARLKELFELSYFQVGLMMLLLNFSSSVIQPLFGYISDRVRTGWFVPGGILWTAVAMGLLGLSPNYATAVLLVGLAGLGTAAFHPRAMMAVYLASGLKRGLGAAIFSTGGNLGFALGPVIGSLLVLGIGLHGTVGLIPVGLLLFLIISFYPNDFLRREAVSPAAAATAAVDYPPVPWRSVTAVCLLVTVRSWVYMSMITYLPLFFQARGMHLQSGSLLLTVYLACGAVAGLFGGHLSDTIGRKKVIVGSFLLYPLLAALLLLSHGPWVWLLAGLSGAALLASFSVTVVLAQELLPRYLGLASGLILGLGFGTGGLGTALSGFLADHIGLETTFWILAAVPLFSLPLVRLIRKPPEAEAGATA
ncbi:MFS transporter [Desulfatitalea alkaliphila]|uniref:MFS transporter n=1 Tax=Desulfatitalea alkaliphila TaxID=2929485 RepID=A0AA41R3J5_9BACT|nr:MFS transporter [Desulfatitalea alkaliphila]MCJ8501006.1 MFS transporter [Desulfatitalea alkaliphila]